MSGPDQPPDPASEADGNLPARLGEERLNAPVIRQGLFGALCTLSSP